MSGVTLRRDPRGAAGERWDAVVIGGGIYGVALLFEAARRGLRALLVERDDFGQHTSWNSLRVVHGGLRYLQTMDLHRFRESVGERRWLLRHFPDLVHPLPCLMPLYGRGLRRPAVFRQVFRLDHWLGRDRNDGVAPDRHLPAGRVLDPAETVARFPAVARDGLAGAGLWHDAAMPESQILLIELLRWAASGGGRALNYVEATGLLQDRGGVAGIAAIDRETGESFAFRAPVVINAAGPWSRALAAAFDRDHPPLFRPSLAMNLFLDRPPPSSAALAVEPRRPGGGRTYFLHPWKDRILAGTCHAPRTGEHAGSPPRSDEIAEFLADLNAAVPELALSPEAVLRVHWGLLPVRRDGGVDLTVREIIHDHAAAGGPRGFYSVSGVKFTTARLVAEKTWAAVLSRAPRAGPVPPPPDRPPPRERPDLDAIRHAARCDPAGTAAMIRRWMEEEAAIRIDDLLLRRTTWATGREPVETLAALLGQVLSRREEEAAVGEARN